MKKIKPASFSVTPIGVISTPFREKFGIPRQPGLVPSAEGELRIFSHPHLKEMLLGLETFSHIWIIFQFHEANARARGTHDFKVSVRPPRLGGAKKMGVFSTRSPHHPNQLGMSAVRLKEIVFPKDPKKDAILRVSGVDILDQTPIVDLKPYLPYSDAIPQAGSGWADSSVNRADITWSPKAEDDLLELISKKSKLELPQEMKKMKTLIEEVLSLDPRPAFQARKNRGGVNDTGKGYYGFTLYDFDIHWCAVSENQFEVIGVFSGAFGSNSI